MASRSSNVGAYSQLPGEEANNLRLRQAITFLNAEGGDEPLDEYKDHVNLIEQHVCRGFLEGGYRFDYSLWRQVKRLVKEQMRNIELLEAANLSGSSLDSELEDDSVEELQREGEDRGVDPPVGGHHHHHHGRGGHRGRLNRPGPARARLNPAAATFTPAASRAADPQQPKPHLPNEHIPDHRWLYGGPHNESEVWLPELPPALPFGETFHMQEWESRKIQFDLQQSALRQPHEDQLVHTNVPFNSVQRRRGTNPYDSGSRYQLPALPAHNDPAWVNWFNQLQQLNLLGNAITDYNDGGGVATQVAKDYTPRIFLEQINPNIVAQAPIRVMPDPGDNRSGAEVLARYRLPRPVGGQQPGGPRRNRPGVKRPIKRAAGGANDANAPKRVKLAAPPRKAAAAQVTSPTQGRPAEGHERVTRGSLRSGRTFRTAST